MADITPARKLFDLLVSRDFDPEMLDSSGKPAADPAETEIYSIDFRAQSGKDYGTVVIMLGDDNDLEVYCSDNVGRSMEGDDKNDWFAFLEQLKNFAVRNFMTFGIKNLNRLRYSMQGQAAIKEGLFESWTGNRTTSWNGAATEARLMIRHKKNIAEGDARFRYIESLFIETADSERYKLPFTSLTAGRAMLEHVRQGGRPYDARGNHISEMVTELAVLSRFRRANQGQIFEGDTQQLLEQVKEYQSNLQRSLKGLGTRTGYTTYFESWSPAEISEQDVVIESLKNLFVKQSIDTRIESALPLLAKIQQQGTEMKEANIFEAWVERLAEGTWALPDTPEKQDQLIELLSTDLPVGADATNATEQLYDLVGDDELFDQLGELAERDANADARQVIMDRLQELSDFPEVRSVLDQLQIDATAEMNPPEATNPADLEPMNESVLNDSTGSTLQHILDTFKRDVRDFKETGEVSDELHNALYDYYFDDMPYGTKKARDGDPYEWVADRFGADLGIAGYGGNSPGMPDSDYSMERESVGDYADEYQDSLSGMLKIAGVPAKQRPAPQYDHSDMEEGILGTVGGGLAGLALGGPLGGIIGAGVGQAATDGGSSLIEKDEEQINEILPALALGAVGRAAGMALGNSLSSDDAPVAEGQGPSEAERLDHYQDLKASGMDPDAAEEEAYGTDDWYTDSIDDAPTAEAIDPTNPRDYEIPTVQRRSQGQAPLTSQDIQQKDRKAQFDFYKLAHGKPHPDDTTVEGWKGQLAGGTAGTLAGGALGAVGGPIGVAVGGALGGTAGQMIGDKLGGVEEGQLNEVIGPAIAAGARALMPLLAKIGPALGRMASQGGKAAGQAATAAAPVAGQVAKQAAQAAGQVAKQGAEIVAKNALPIGAGVGAYQSITDLAKMLGTGVGEVYNDIGGAAAAITKAVGSAVDGKTIGDLAAAAVKYAIPIGLLLALLYGGKKLIDTVLDESQVETDEGKLGALAGGAVGGYATKSVKGAVSGAKLGSALQDRFIKKDDRGPLAGQYGHAGKMKEVSKDTSFLDRLKELSGMKK